jgi:hypothetical protein
MVQLGKKTDPSPFQCFCGHTSDTAAEALVHSMVMHPDPPKETKKEDKPKEDD